MIGILCLIDLNYIPYLNKYTSYLEEKGLEYEVVYWKRLKDVKEYPFRTVEYKYEADLSLNKLMKIKGFCGFRKFVIDTLKEKKYEKVIVLSTLMGILITNYLLKNYKNRFVFDIRDFTYENIYFFKKLEKKIISASYFTTISSNGFKEFLPKSDKYILCHNFLKEEINKDRFFKKRQEMPLEVSFIGAIRHFDLDKSVVDAFLKDSRFRLVFHGYGASYERLKEYVSNKNVMLTGKYDRKDKEQLLSTCDVINSYYDEANIVNRYAVSNKFYDAIIYKKPLWANPNTYMGQMAIERGIGLDCGINPDKMYIAYDSIDKDEFNMNCDALLDEILHDEERFKTKLGEFV